MKRMKTLACAVTIALGGTPLSVSAQAAGPAVAARHTSQAVAAENAGPAKTGVKQITVERVKAGAVQVDGRLDDAVWARATFHSDFDHKGTDRSYPPRVRTEFAFLLDEEALYLGARMQNDVGGAPRVLLGRRDDAGSAERILVSLDTH